MRGGYTQTPKNDGSGLYDITFHDNEMEIINGNIKNGNIKNTPQRIYDILFTSHLFRRTERDTHNQQVRTSLINKIKEISENYN